LHHHNALLLRAYFLFLHAAAVVGICRLPASSPIGGSAPPSHKTAAWLARTPRHAHTFLPFAELRIFTFCGWCLTWVLAFMTRVWRGYYDVDRRRGVSISHRWMLNDQQTLHRLATPLFYADNGGLREELHGLLLAARQAAVVALREYLLM
jgi:hypothetical protein